jgi:hypothetical protein
MLELVRPGGQIGQHPSCPSCLSSPQSPYHLVCEECFIFNSFEPILNKDTNVYQTYLFQKRRGSRWVDQSHTILGNPGPPWRVKESFPEEETAKDKPR